VKNIFDKSRSNLNQLEIWPEKEIRKKKEVNIMPALINISTINIFCSFTVIANN